MLTKVQEVCGVALAEIYQGIRQPAGGMNSWQEQLKLRMLCLKTGSRIEQLNKEAYCKAKHNCKKMDAKSKHAESQECADDADGQYFKLQINTIFSVISLCMSREFLHRDFFPFSFQGIFFLSVAYRNDVLLRRGLPIQSEVAGERRGDGPWVPAVSANEKEQSAIDVTQCQSVLFEKDTRADSDTFSSGLPGSASDGDNDDTDSEATVTQSQSTDCAGVNTFQVQEVNYRSPPSTAEGGPKQHKSDKELQHQPRDFIAHDDIETALLPPVMPSSSSGRCDAVDGTASEAGIQNKVTDPGDPALYINVRLLQSTIELLLHKDHVPDDNFVFPVTSGRACSRDWFFKAMPDGQKRVRKWLSYSSSVDSLFCIDCLLFSGPSATSHWTHDGYCDWPHAKRDIGSHEISLQHRTSEMARFTWMTKSRVNDRLHQITQSTSARNRRVVYVSIKCLKYLASEMVAIRGHKSDDGKFLHLFREFAEFDAASAAYLEMLSRMRSAEYMRKPEINLLSPMNIRRLLVTMRDMVVDKILAEVQKTKTCSIISDGTQDESKLEAQCVIVRYLEETSCGLRPVERLIDIFTTGDTSGQTLSNRILQILREKKVSLEWIVGQSYDGAGNVRGKYSGLKTLILQEAPRALYVWCSAHRLNLVVEAVLKSSPDLRNALGVMQELYNFFTGHKRHSVLMRMQEGNTGQVRTLKRVADTTRSWRSAEDGTCTVLECFDAVTAALETLADESEDSTTTAAANGLLRNLHDVRFIMSIMFLKRILSTTGPISRLLQNPASDLSIAATLIDGCVQKLTVLRSEVDDFYEQIKHETADFCAQHNIDPILKPRPARKTKRMPGEQTNDERIHVAEIAFKIEVVIAGIDTVLLQLNDRFAEENVQFLREMRHFTPAAMLSSKPVSADEIQHLCHFYKFDADVIARERNDFMDVYKTMAHMIDTSNMFASVNVIQCRSHNGEDNNDDECDVELEQLASQQSQQGQQHYNDAWVNRSFVKPLRALEELSSFTSLSCLIKILATVAVTSCSAERVMSRIKIIKNRLRSRMADDWFSALTVLASERDILEGLAVDTIIDRFTLLSPKLQKQLG